MLSKNARCLVVVALLFLIVGCTEKITYRLAEQMTVWMIADYVQWDEGQSAEFEQRFSNLVAWHQRTQLPVYSDFLRQLQERFETPLSREYLLSVIARMEAFSREAIVKAGPDATYLLASLSDKQVKSLVKKMYKRHKKLEKKYRYGDQKKLDAERVGEVENFAERFIGDLSEQQKNLLLVWNEQLVDSRFHWLDDIKYRQQQFAALLQQREQSTFAQELEFFLLQTMTAHDLQYQRLIDSRIEHTITLIIDLQATFSEAQNKHLKQELNKWIVAFNELADEVAPQ